MLVANENHKDQKDIPEEMRKISKANSAEPNPVSKD